MRHLNKNRKLSRVKKVRVALLNSIARSLILHGKIKTTEPKAKEVKSFVEKLVTKGKKATVASRRDITVSVGKEATKRVVDELSKKYEKREGGYTRIIKAGARKSDGSSMAIIEFV
jgi:large subunit ribosomal protein L17